MKKIIIIVMQELRILLKDRQALALLFLMPLALIAFLTFALQDVYHSKVGRTTILTVLTDEDCSVEKSSCSVLLKKLIGFEYRVRVARELDPLFKTELVLVLPKNIEATIKKLQKQKALNPEEQMKILFDPLLDHSARTLIESHLMLSLQGMLIERLHKELKGAPLNAKLTDVSQFEGLVVKSALGGVVLPNPIQQTVPAWSLFGMFFILIPLTNSMIRDRSSGVFKRLLSFPVSKWHLILGKLLPFYFINLFQFVTMFAFGLFILPKLTGLELQLDFNVAGLIIVTLSSALAATTYGLMISCFAETSEQAHAFGAFSIVILAIIGGVMIPSYVMPGFMQKISMISPMHWGLEAYLDLLVKKLSLKDVLPKVYWLLGFSFFSVVIASFKFRWDQGD